MTDSGQDEAPARLRATYGEFPVDAETYEVPPVVFERLLDRAEKGALGGARAAPRRGGAVLLVRTIDDDGAWSVPGGERAPGESYAETAVRTVREESGLALSVGPLLAVKRFTFVDAADPDSAVVGHWAWFGGSDDGGRAEPQRRGVLEAGWFTELPGGVDDLAAERIDEWVERERSAVE